MRVTTVPSIKNTPKKHWGNMPEETGRCASIAPSTKWEYLTSEVVPGFGAGAQV